MFVSDAAAFGAVGQHHSHVGMSIIGMRNPDHLRFGADVILERAINHMLESLAAPIRLHIPAQ
jgi:hypothetical protein